MGGNGSKGEGFLEDEATREYKTIHEIEENIKVVIVKSLKARVKLPEESHTPNRIYVTVNRSNNAKDANSISYGKLKGIAVYGNDCKKLYEIHVDHKHAGMPIHYHPWIDGKPKHVGNGKHADTVAYPLTEEMTNLLNKVLYKIPYGK